MKTSAQMPAKTSLLIFAKAPIVGSSKTRLIPLLGEEKAAQAHERLTMRTLQSMAVIANAAEGVSISLWGGSSHPRLASLAADFDYRFTLQQGTDLGGRMLHALSTELDDGGAEQAILIGTDCPLIAPQYIGDAQAALRYCDVVLGPAEDGGYVLVGCKRHLPELFQGIEWGSSEVLEQTVAAGERAGLTITLLDTLWDVDRPEDWLRFLELDDI